MEPKRQKLDPDKVDETNYDAWNFNDFPNEIIQKIFSILTQNQLGQIARVCRKWSVLSKSPALWRNVDVKIFCSRDEERDAQCFNSFIDGLPSCVKFIRLDFSGRGGFKMDLDFQKLCMKLRHSCPHAEVLILPECIIPTSLPEVIDSCTQFLPGLKKLVLNSCLFEDHSGTTEPKDNSNIEVLDLSSSYSICYRKTQFLKLVSLKELRLAGSNVNDDWFVGDTSFLNQLHVLDLRWTRVTANTFTAIQRHGQNLKELYVCDLRLRDHDFSFNSPLFPHLQKICLCNTLVTGEGLVSLVRSCPSLVSVYVDEDLARSFAEHPFVVANRCKSGIVKNIHWIHDHGVDYSPN